MGRIEGQAQCVRQWILDLLRLGFQYEIPPRILKTFLEAVGRSIRTFRPCGFRPEW